MREGEGEVREEEERADSQQLVAAAGASRNDSSAMCSRFMRW